MTHDPIDTPNDIAWMRQLAEEGAQTPMRGGSFLMTGGLVFGIASLFHWAFATGLLPGSMDAVWIPWLASGLIYAAFIAIATPQLKRTETVQTTANKASAIAWSAMGWGIFAMFVSMVALGWKLGVDTIPVISALIPSIIMVFYATGWAVSAVMHRSRAMWILSIASFIAAPVLALFAGSTAQYLAYAAALIGLMGLPGYIFMRAAGK